MTDHQAEQEIRQQETRRFAAMVRADLATLDEILADDLTYTHASGAHESKAQFIANLKSGQVKYESLTPEDTQIRLYGPAAVATGMARVTVQVGGERKSFRLRYTDVYVKTDGRWRMIAWQATRLPQD